jgi:hypothetical protein
MYGGTPTVQVMEGVTQYMRDWQMQHPDRKSVIVLATDGIPDDTCLSVGPGETPNSLANAVLVTGQTAHGTPPIATFIIGVGTDLDKLKDLSSAAGTDPIFVDTAGDIAAQFEKALNTIRKQAIPCDYDLPDLGAGFDVEKVNVQFTPDANSPTQLFTFVTDASACSSAMAKGWFFDDPAKPTKLSLCPDSCAAVKASDTGRVDVTYGCKRRMVLR